MNAAGTTGPEATAVTTSGRRCVAVFVAALAALVAVASVAPVARAQTGQAARADTQRAARPDTSASPQPRDTRPRVVSGRIMRPATDTVLPVSGIWVVIHRVGSDTAAPLDSMRSRRDGSFTFHYRPFGDPNAIYFVSASYDGIAYFSEPLKSRSVTGPDAEITVFDTTSAPVPLHVRGRHIVVASPRADGTREVMEVYELSNDTTVTRVAPDDAHPTWTAILPQGITDFQPGQMDVSPQTMRLANGELEVVAPFAPGLKQLSFSYRVPSGDFPLSVPIEHGAMVLEVLVEEPAAQVSGARLQQVAGVSVQGRVFSRYLAQDVPANSVLRIQVPEVTPVRNPLYLVGVAIAVGVAMLVALAMAFRRRVPRQPAAYATSAAAAVENPDQLARAIAQLDGSFERRSSPSAEDRAVYERTREALKHRLAVALEAERHAE